MNLKSARVQLGSAPFLKLWALPEIFCLWAGTLTAFDGNNLKHLRRRIRWGNWASRGPVIEQWHCRH